MNRVISFVRLDFITIKPYLTAKNLLLFVGVALIMLIANDSMIGAIGLLMSFAALYASYPFAIGEKSNIDVLYTTLSIPRNTVVMGRYLFALTLDMLAGFFTFSLSYVVLSVMQREVDVIATLSAIPVMFFVFSLIQAIQLPMYFKLSYTKARFIAYMPFIVLPLAIGVGSSFFKDILGSEQIIRLYGWLVVNPYKVALISLAIWLACMAISYRLSLYFYAKRDF